MPYKYQAQLTLMARFRQDNTDMRICVSFWITVSTAA